MTVFIFKKGIFWLGWIYDKGVEEETLYADSKPYTTIHSAGIRYLTITLTQSSAINRVVKYLKRAGIGCESSES